MLWVITDSLNYFPPVGIEIYICIIYGILSLLETRTCHRIIFSSARLRRALLSYYLLFEYMTLYSKLYKCLHPCGLFKRLCLSSTPLVINFEEISALPVCVTRIWGTRTSTQYITDSRMRHDCQHNHRQRLSDIQESPMSREQSSKLQMIQCLFFLILNRIMQH